MKIGRGVSQEYCLSPILFNLYSEYLIKEALEGFRDSKPGQVIRTVKHTDDPILLAKEEDVLQGMTDRRIEIATAVEWKLMCKKLR